MAVGRYRAALETRSGTYCFTEHKTSVVTAGRVPEWAQRGDPIVIRVTRTFLVSLTQTEPRWKALLRRVRDWRRQT